MVRLRALQTSLAWVLEATVHNGQTRPNQTKLIGGGKGLTGFAGSFYAAPGRNHDRGFRAAQVPSQGPRIRHVDNHARRGAVIGAGGS